MYRDENEDEQPALCVSLRIRDVCFLHELRDLALTGELDYKLSDTPIAGDRFVVQIDPSQFASMYEESVLSLDKLTKHQETKLQACMKEDRVHLRAPAGGGKTFVALNRIVQLMADEREST
eukprot:3062737-Prymnesium_polylepis.2